MSAAESNWASWVEKADNDLLCIRNNLAAQHVPWDAVCYHAQQAAEKMLKAYVVYHGQHPQRTHDLGALLHECLTYDGTLSEISDACQILNPFSVDVRYPGCLFALGAAEGLPSVEAADRVHDAIRRRLQAKEHEERAGGEP